MIDKEKNQRLTELDIEKRELEISKLKQEQEKIELEVKDLKKSSFKKTNWWSIVIPLSFSIIPVLYLLLSGIFDNKYQEYKANKAILELDQRNFTDIKDSINDRITTIKDSLFIVENLFKSKRDSLQSFKNLVNQKEELLSSLSSNIQLSKKQITELEDLKNKLSNDIEQKDKLVAEISKQKQRTEKELNDSLKKIRYDLVISNSNINTMKYYREKADANASYTIQDLVLQLKIKNKMIKELEQKLTLCK